MARRAGSEIASGPRGLKCRRDPGGYAGEQGDAEADQRDPRVQRQVEVERTGRADAEYARRCS